MRADVLALQPLVRAYDSGLEVRLAAAEREALPWRIARQPLRAIGAWVALDAESGAVIRNPAVIKSGQESSRKVSKHK